MVLAATIPRQRAGIPTHPLAYLVFIILICTPVLAITNTCDYLDAARIITTVQHGEHQAGPSAHEVFCGGSEKTEMTSDAHQQLVHKCYDKAIKEFDLAMDARASGDFSTGLNHMEMSQVMYPYSPSMRRAYIAWLWTEGCWNRPRTHEQLLYLHMLRRRPMTVGADPHHDDWQDPHVRPNIVGSDLMKERGEPSFRMAAKYKLRHDIDQFKLIAEYVKNEDVFKDCQGGGTLMSHPSASVARIPLAYYAQCLWGNKKDLLSAIDAGLRAYEAAYSAVSHLPDAELFPVHGQGVLPAISKAFRSTMTSSQFFNSLYYVHNVHHVLGYGHETLSDQFDADRVRSMYESAEPGVAYGDNFLNDDTLKDLRDFCLYSTIWHETKPYGYLGAYWQDGFTSPVLMQIASDVQKAFPKILGEHRLTNMWAYKYVTNHTEGVAIHADAAAVNVNFWITPDEYNLDPETGGLRVWRTKPDASLEFMEYNSNPEKAKEVIADAEVIDIGYRSNRMAIFHSDLYHKSMTPRFKTTPRGYRINITLLFGFRNSTSSSKTSANSQSSGSRGRSHGAGRDNDDDVLL